MFDFGQNKALACEGQSVFQENTLLQRYEQIQSQIRRKENLSEIVSNVQEFGNFQVSPDEKGTHQKLLVQLARKVQDLLLDDPDSENGRRMFRELNTLILNNSEPSNSEQRNQRSIQKVLFVGFLISVLIVGLILLIIFLR